MSSGEWRDVSHLEFSARGRSVVFRNTFFCFGDEPSEEAPLEVLMTANPIKGNCGEVMSGEDVAKHIAMLLNKK